MAVERLLGESYPRIAAAAADIFANIDIRPPIFLVPNQVGKESTHPATPHGKVA